MYNKNEYTKRRKNRTNVIIVCFAIALIVSIGLGIFIALSANKAAISQNKPDEDIDSPENDEGFGNTIVHDGEEYVLNENLTTVLFLGIDKSEADRDILTNAGGTSDVMLLFILDNETKTTELLQISRDSMVTVDFYSLSQTISHSVKMQINMQYSAGDSPARACWLSKEKVSQEILYGVPVDYVVSITIDGIVPVVDALGGITHTMQQDYTYLDPMYKQGATIEMNGESVEKFIRYRDINDFGSNNTRMERQTELFVSMAALLGNANSQALITSVQNEVAPYIESTIDVQTMKNLTDFELKTPFYKVPGENVVGESDEYHLDEVALKNMVVELFYQKVA